MAALATSNQCSVPRQRTESTVTTKARSVHYASLVLLRVPDGKVVRELIRFYRQKIKRTRTTRVVAEYLERLCPDGNSASVALFARGRARGLAKKSMGRAKRRAFDLFAPIRKTASFQANRAAKIKAARSNRPYLTSRRSLSAVIAKLYNKKAQVIFVGGSNRRDEKRQLAAVLRVVQRVEALRARGARKSLPEIKAIITARKMELPQRYQRLGVKVVSVAELRKQDRAARPRAVAGAFQQSVFEAREKFSELTTLMPIGGRLPVKPAARQGAIQPLPHKLTGQRTALRQEIPAAKASAARQGYRHETFQTQSLSPSLRMLAEDYQGASARRQPAASLEPLLMTAVLPAQGVDAGSLPLQDAKVAAPQPQTGMALEPRQATAGDEPGRAEGKRVSSRVVKSLTLAQKLEFVRKMERLAARQGQFVAAA